MAKLSLNKLGLKLNQNVQTFEFNGYEIEVKQYLPINDKLKLIGDVIGASMDDNNFANPVKIDVFTALYVIEAYTNITLTEKQKSEPEKVYDILQSNGVLDNIIEAIPEDEYNTIVLGIHRSVKSYFKYKNSIMGILDTISTDYSNLNLEATEIQQKLADPQNLELLRNILTKLG